MQETSTLSTDSISNDLYINNEGNISFSFGIQSILETCEHVIKCRLGEVFINTSIGIPYFETVFVGVPNLVSYEAAIRSAILTVPNVIGINALDIVLSDNQLSYTIEIVTNLGTGTIGTTTI